MLEIIKNPEVLLLSFKNCINKYNMVVELKEKGIYLKNQYALLDIYIDWGALECDLYINNDYERYSLKTIPYFGFYSDFKIILNDPESYKLIINSFLNETLSNGSYDWVSTYRKNIEKSRKILETVYNLPNSHPIKIKFLKDDPTWRIDIVNLK